MKVRRELPPGKKYRIEVRKRTGEVVEVIERVLRLEQYGIYTVFFCTYNGSSRIIRSGKSDFPADPFKKKVDFSDTLYIEQGDESEERNTNFPPIY